MAGEGSEGPPAPPSPGGYDERAIPDEEMGVDVAAVAAGGVGDASVFDARHVELSLGGESSSENGAGGIAGEMAEGSPAPPSSDVYDGRAVSDDDVVVAVEGGGDAVASGFGRADLAVGGEGSSSGDGDGDVARELAKGSLELLSPGGYDGRVIAGDQGVGAVQVVGSVTVVGVEALGDVASGSRHAELSLGGDTSSDNGGDSIAEKVAEALREPPSVSGHDGRTLSNDGAVVSLGAADMHANPFVGGESSDNGHLDIAGETSKELPEPPALDGYDGRVLSDGIAALVVRTDVNDDAASDTRHAEENSTESSVGGESGSNGHLDVVGETSGNTPDLPLSLIHI